MIISLTSIPPRFPALHRTLETLLAQSETVDGIFLYLPKVYRRFGPCESVPRVPNGVEIRRLDEDFGPATKLLGALEDYRSTNVPILFCDDDHYYHRDWVRRFRRAGETRPADCIVERGYLLDDLIDTYYSGHRQPRPAMRARRRKRAIDRVRGWLSPREAPHRRFRCWYESSGFVDQIGGWGGVLVRPDFFTNDIFDIPDQMWMVDDAWISGHLEKNGIGIWLNAEGISPVSHEGSTTEALLTNEVGGARRDEANLAAIRYFRETYGIWMEEAGMEPALVRSA